MAILNWSVRGGGGRLRERVRIISVVSEINILGSNVRGIVNNWDAIINLDLTGYDIIALNEIWAIKDFESLQLQDFDISSVKTRVNGRGGGVIIFAKNYLKTESLNVPFIGGVFETVGIKIGNTVVINVYRPPSGNRVVFFQEMENLLETYRLNDIIITGDFNINFMTQLNEISTICDQYGAKIKINGITRPASGTCLDNFITNLDGNFSISNICIADHLAIKAKIILKDRVKKIKVAHKYRAMKEINWLLFKDKIHNMVIAGDSTEDKWNDISNKIKLAVEASFPLKTAKHEHKFTMSRGLMKSRDKKNRLLRDFKAGRVSKEVYISYNRLYRKLISIEQEKSFKSKLTDAGTCGKKKWKVLKKELLLEKEKKNIDLISDSNLKITDKKIIAEKFKTHFETCALSLASNLPPSQDTSDVMPQGNNWSFNTVAEIDIAKIIGTLKSKNSCGSDLLSNRMIKAERFGFARLLKPLINASILEGSFPDCLKTAIVIPVFKKGNTELMNNYRPISLLPVMSKVFEKVINNQLTNVIENGYIDENQFGFRRAHSTEDALLKFADKVQRELAENKHVVSVFVDVSKAFDSCDHGILITKIKRTGLSEIGIKLIQSYLRDRKQHVIVNGVDGGSFVINIGVGQGTILGPTFFKIYIMDLHLHTKLFSMKFADDSSFIGSGTSRDEVQSLVNNELKKVSDWFVANRLTLHPSKSKFLVHSRDKLIEIRLNDTVLQRSGYGLQEESVKLLGVDIDENLDWKCHEQAVIKKLIRGVIYFGDIAENLAWQ